MRDSVVCNDLLEAANSGNLQELTRLLDEGAEINATDITKSTALHIFARKGNVDGVELLLSRGADFNLQDSTMENPLSLAIRCQNIAVVKAMLERGVGLDVKGGKNTALHLAVRTGNIAIVQLILGKMDTANVADDIGWTPLHCVATVEENFADIARLLLSKGVDINKVELRGRTALHLASEFGSVDNVTFLLRHWANLGVVDLDGNSALQLAAERANVGVMKVLLEHDAPIDSEVIESLGSKIMEPGHCGPSGDSSYVCQRLLIAMGQLLPEMYKYGISEELRIKLVARIKHESRFLPLLLQYQNRNAIPEDEAYKAVVAEYEAGKRPQSVAAGEGRGGEDAKGVEDNPVVSVTPAQGSDDVIVPNNFTAGGDSHTTRVNTTRRRWDCNWFGRR